MKILIAEDETRLADAIADALKGANYDVDCAFDGIEGAQKATSGQYDLVVLDIMLPGKDGFSILEEIRRMHPETRVIILSAKGELDDKLKGLEHGADDYMTKPFHFEELIARVNLQLRKKNEESGEILSLGNLQLDRKKGLLYNESNGQTLPISGKEYALTEYFLEHPSQILSREQLYNKVWGWDNNIESNNLEAYLSFIRKKLRLLGVDVSIKAIRGMGYRIETSEK